MLDVPLAYGIIIEISVTIASILHFITKRTMVDRLHLIITLVGFFAILGFFEGNLFYAQAFFVIWLTVSGVKMMLPREALVILLLAMLVLPMLSPVFLVITFVFHVVVLWGFIYSAFQELGQMLAKRF